VLNSIKPQTEIKERILPNKKISIKQTKRKKGAPQSDLVVFQHNNLVEANYRISLQEKRIILWLMSQIQRNDVAFKEHFLKVTDFIEVAGLSGESAYEEIKKVTLKLIGRVLTIHKIDKKEEVQVSWLNCVRYIHNEGLVALNFAPEMQSFLLELKSKFTAIKLSDLMQFSSVYAIRIYELLKQYENIGERTIRIEAIRKNCGIENKLKKYSSFKKDLLLIAQREVNLKSDIAFEFEEIKTGRKIAKIKFKIFKNTRNTKQNPIIIGKIVKRPPPVFFALEEFGLTKRMINKIIRDEKEEEITSAIKAVEAQMKKGGVKNPKAMLITAIKEKWRPDVFKKRNPKS
jgi:plasmid replication initiation protein